jgi:hypothetical protein
VLSVIRFAAVVVVEFADREREVGRHSDGLLGTVTGRWRSLSWVVGTVTPDSGSMTQCRTGFQMINGGAAVVDVAVDPLETNRLGASTLPRAGPHRVRHCTLCSSTADSRIHATGGDPRLLRRDA